MMNNLLPLSGIASMTSDTNTPSAITLEERIAGLSESELPPHFEALYEALKGAWESGELTKSKDINAWLSQFVVDDKTPYQDMHKQEHLVIITQIMTQLKTQGGEDSDFYKELNQAAGWGILAQGTYSNFMQEMMKEAEIEEW